METSEGWKRLNWLRRPIFFTIILYNNLVWFLNMIRMRWICRLRPLTSCWRIDARRGFNYRDTPVPLLRPAWALCGRSKEPTTTNRLFTRRSWRTLQAISFQSITATSATKAKVISVLFLFFWGGILIFFLVSLIIIGHASTGASGRNGRAIKNVKLLFIFFPHIPQK